MTSVFNLCICFLFYTQATILSFQILSDLENLLKDFQSEVLRDWEIGVCAQSAVGKLNLQSAMTEWMSITDNVIDLNLTYEGTLSDFNKYIGYWGVPFRVCQGFEKNEDYFIYHQSFGASDSSRVNWNWRFSQYDNHR